MIVGRFKRQRPRSSATAAARAAWSGGAGWLVGVAGELKRIAGVIRRPARARA